MASGSVVTSDSTGQVRLRLEWTATQDGQNSSYLWVGIYLESDYSVNFSSTKHGNLNFDGTDYGFDVGGRSGSGSQALLYIDFHGQPHNSNGDRNWDRLVATFDLNISYGGNWIGEMAVDTNNAGGMTFDHISHTAPSVPDWGPSASPSSCLSGDTISISWGGGGSMGQNASFDHSELQWNWNDTTWGGVYSAAGFSTSVSMPNIPGGHVQFRVKIVNNYGLSSDWAYTGYVECLGATKFNSVQDFHPDDASPSLAFNCTVYNSSFTDNLVLKASDGTTMLTRSGIKLTSGDNTITMSSAERTTFLNKMPNSTQLIVHFETTTYNGSTSVGGNSSGNFSGYTQSATSSPTFSNSAAFTINDSNSTTKTITGTSGDSTVLIKGYSTLVITPYAGTAKNGASIVSYSCSIASTTQTNTNGSAMAIGIISQAGSIPCTVTITDSRGYVVQYTKYITVTDYSPIQILTYQTSVTRNGYETETTLVVNGTMSQILVGATNKNAFGILAYRFKKTTDSSYPSSGTGSWTVLPVLVPGTSISLTDTDLLGDATDTHGFLIGNSYNIQVTVTDKLTTYTVTLTLSKAIPVMTIGNGKIGINQPNPTKALDVSGEILLNGRNISPDASPYNGTMYNFNDALINGSYGVNSSTSVANAPYTGKIKGKLHVEIFNNTIYAAGTLVHQYFDDNLGNQYYRFKEDVNYVTQPDMSTWPNTTPSGFSATYNSSTNTNTVTVHAVNGYERAYYAFVTVPGSHYTFSFNFAVTTAQSSAILHVAAFTTAQNSSTVGSDYSKALVYTDIDCSSVVSSSAKSITFEARSSITYITFDMSNFIDGASAGVFTVANMSLKLYNTWSDWENNSAILIDDNASNGYIKIGSGGYCEEYFWVGVDCTSGGIHEFNFSYPLAFSHVRAAGVLGWRPLSTWDGVAKVLGKPSDANPNTQLGVDIDNYSTEQTYYLWCFAVGII